MKKRILLISPSELCVGGISKVLMTIVQELHNDYLFDIATLSAKSGYYDEAFSSFGGKIYRIPSFQYLDHKVLYPLSFFQIYVGLAQILKQNQYDVIHCHGGWQDAACHLAARKHGIAARISHGHGTYVWEGRNLVMRFYTGFAKKLVQKYATTRLACSSIAGNTLFSSSNYDNILNPVDVEYYANNSKIPHDGINIVQIGYFCKNKNQLFSINILNYLRKNGINAHLSLIGYPNERNYLDKMHALINQYNLEQYISLLPHDYDKRNAFAQADYCVLPSESEGLPLVALESQAAGVPCLMSDRIARDSDVGAGFFLPHDDLEKWADAIISGVSVDFTKLAQNLKMISTQAYAEKIRNVYEQNANKDDK